RSSSSKWGWLRGLRAAARRLSAPPLLAPALLRDAQARPVGVELGLSTEGIGLLVSLRGDLGHWRLRPELTPEELRERSVLHRLLVVGGLGNAEVEHHVRALQARLNGTQVVLGRRLAHARRLPWPQVVEVRRAVWVEAGLADGHVDARLRRLGHVPH